MIEESFNLPPLFILICMGLGLAVFFAPHVWLLRLIRAGDQILPSLGQQAFAMAMSVFFTVAVLSLLWVQFEGQGSSVIEIFVIVALYGGAHIQAHCAGTEPLRIPLKIIWGWFSKNLQVMLMALAGFALIQGLLLVFAFANIQSGDILFAPVREATFFTGVFWIGMLYFLYKLAQKRGVLPEGTVFHRLLWPLVLGLFLIMLPLLVQEVATSDSFRVMMDAPRPLQKV